MLDLSYQAKDTSVQRLANKLSISTLEIKILPICSSSILLEEPFMAKRYHSTQILSKMPGLSKKTKHPPSLKGSNREWKITRNQILRGTNGVRRTHNQCCHHNNPVNESNTSFCVFKSSHKQTGRLNRIQSSTWFRLCHYYNGHSNVYEVVWLRQNNYHAAKKNNNGPILHRRINSNSRTGWFMFTI